MTPYTHGGDVLTARTRFGGDVLDCSANLNPLGMPPAVQAAAAAAAADSARYPDPLCRALRAAIAAHDGVAPEQVLCGGGAAELIFRLAYALGPRRAMVTAPAFSEYEEALTAAGCAVTRHPLRRENRFDVDGGLLDVIAPGVELVFLCTPNNPTGGVLSEDVLKELADIAISNDLMVISDEVYERLVYDGAKHISIASLPSMKERTFTMNGMSKAYAMDGWRLGYVAAPEEYILAMNKFHQHNTTCAPNFVQVAAIAALTQEGDEVKEMVKEYQRRRDYAVKAINEIPGLHCECPKGAFYIFINCKSLNMKSADLSAYLLEEAKIALVPGDVFGPGGEGYLRMSFANSYENVVEGCAQLKKAVALLQQKP